MPPSIVEYSSNHSGYKCGYCKSPNTNYSRGIWAHTMSVGDYQDLIDRGWRRSGFYCYKPTMDLTCCPMYTIRCRAQEFKATKSQKKIMKKFNRFLNGQEDEQVGETGRRMSTSSSEIEQCGDGQENFVESNRKHQTIDVNSVETVVLDVLPGESSQVIKLSTATESGSIPQKEVKKDSGPDPNKPPCLKAKQLRRQRKLDKLKEKGIDVTNLTNTCKNKEKSLEDFINDLPNDVKNKLEIRLVRTTPPSQEWLATAKETHQVYIKYQTVIHNDKLEKLTENKFHEFLVQSPLAVEYRDSGPTCGYGSFHQQYWIDGKIIAVGVIDILPKCVSSVYFFYDPAYTHLTLGTYGALREIAFTRELQKSSPELQHYYMGFYIHSCRKMRYKGNFFPSDLLCPETYKWFPLEDCIPKLEASRYSRLNPDLDDLDNNCPSEADLNDIRVYRPGEGTILYKQIRKYINKDIMMEYAQLVGRKTARSMIYVNIK